MSRSSSVKLNRSSNDIGGKAGRARQEDLVYGDGYPYVDGGPLPTAVEMDIVFRGLNVVGRY